MNDITDKVDYILHTAAITDSSSFVNKPVETILIGLQGINNVLDYAYKNEIQSVVFLSSMEVYGEGFGLKEIDENMIGSLRPLEVRNSYPIMKIMSENLCISYFNEYGVNVKLQDWHKLLDQELSIMIIECLWNLQDVLLKKKILY